jgi:hypothetical protein
MLCFSALWENCPVFIHSQFRDFAGPEKLLQVVEINKKYLVIHRTVPDIVY